MKEIGVGDVGVVKGMRDVKDVGWEREKMWDGGR